MNLNYVALAQGAGSVFMFLVGSFGSFDVFLFFGNLLCVVGNAIWVYVIHSGEMNERTMVVFAALALANLFALGRQVRRCREPSKEDSDDEGEMDDAEWEEKTKELLQESRQEKSGRKDGQPASRPRGKREKK